MTVNPRYATADVEVFCGEALEVLRGLTDGYADACVTSPPYLDSRPEYPGVSLPVFEQIFSELARVVDGPIVLNVGRLWRDGSEVLWWAKVLERAQWAGWNLADTLIWHKPNANPIQGAVVTNAHEYVFLLGNVDDFDPGRVRTPYAEGSVARLGRRWVSSISVKGDTSERNGARRDQRRGERKAANPDGARAKSVVSVHVGRAKGNPHPAPMPLELAEHLVLLSGGQTILDPFAGSGTTAIAARRWNRSSILIDSDEGFCSLAASRLALSYEEIREREDGQLSMLEGGLMKRLQLLVRDLLRDVCELVGHKKSPFTEIDGWVYCERCGSPLTYLPGMDAIRRNPDGSLR